VATTKIWAVKGSLRSLVEYVKNLEGGLVKRSAPCEKPKPVSVYCRLNGNSQIVNKLTGCRALYFKFLYLIGKLSRNMLRTPRHPILWEDVRKLRKYTEQIRLIGRYKIDTPDQLREFTDAARSHMNELIRQRTHIQNKLRRAKAPEVIEGLKAEKTALTAHITPLRRNLATAAEIEEHAATIKGKMAVIRNLETQERQVEHQRRYRYAR